MSESNENKVWSPEDIVNNASNWSLAADKELLKYLHNLSEKILSNANKTNDNLLDLLDSLDRTGLSLDLANINLESLHHTQFIESRVYEDDDEFDVDETKPTHINVDKTVEEEKTRKEIEEGLLTAVKAIEEYYEYKEVPNSDSDDENDSPNCVWQAKDPYLTRPLPYVIGTTEWYRKWHVGLIDDSSDDDVVTSDVRTVKDDIDSQSSDDDRYLPPLHRRSTMPLDNDGRNSQWQSSQVIDIDINPLANSTLVPSTGEFNENSEKSRSFPAQEPNDLTFAEQLAKRLGNIANAQLAKTPPEINTRPIKKASIKSNVNIFSDEPPPLDDSDSSDSDMFGKPGSSNGALFGRSDAGLFDDLDKSETSEAVKQIRGDIKKSESPALVSNIFDNDSETEDDLFAPKPADKMATSSKYLPRSFTTAMPLFDDEPPPVLPQEEKKKRPIGGVSIFGNTDIMKGGSVVNNLKQASIDSTAELDVASSINKTQETEQINVKCHNSSNVQTISSSSNKPVENKPEIKVKISKSDKKPVSLFDEDNLFEDDLFSNVSTKKFTSNLFEENDSFNDSLFYTSNVPSVKKHNLFDAPKPSKQNSIFDDSSNNVSTVTFDRSANVKTDINKSERAKLFDDTKTAIKTDINKSERAKLFDDTKTEPKTANVSLFDDTVKSDNDNVKNDILKPEPSKRNSLFSNKVANNPPEPTTKRRNLFEDDDLACVIDTALPIAQNTLDLWNTANRPNLFDHIPGKKLIDNENVKIASESVKIASKNVKIASENDKTLPILTIPTKNIESTDKITKILRETDVTSISEPVTSDLSMSKNLTAQLSLFDTPPDIEDDFDTDSENLFNDENHLIFEDDSNDLSTPAYKSSIFDVEPPLLPSDIKNKRTESAIVAPPTESIGNNEVVSSDILAVENNFTRQLLRSNISIHDRLNSIDIENMSDEKNGENVKNHIPENSEGKITAENDGKTQEKEDIKELACSQRKIGNPGKIKHNLNIDVATLLPVSAIKPEAAKMAVKIAKNLDELDNTVEILQCITKDRAKIPVKRRPSTRKGRNENSIKTHAENIENNNKIIQKIPDSSEMDQINQNLTGAVKKSSVNQPLLFTSSESSDSDDIFKAKPPLSKTKNTPHKTTSNCDIFKGLKSQSLFDKQPVIKGDVFESPDYKKSKIFFDDDDDFFSSKKLPPKSDIMKKSLFDDEEEGDDLFQSHLFQNDLKPAKITGPVKKTSKTTPLFPVTDATDDPLELFK